MGKTTITATTTTSDGEMFVHTYEVPDTGEGIVHIPTILLPEEELKDWPKPEVKFLKPKRDPVAVLMGICYKMGKHQEDLITLANDYDEGVIESDRKYNKIRCEAKKEAIYEALQLFNEAFECYIYAEELDEEKERRW